VTVPDGPANILLVGAHYCRIRPHYCVFAQHRPFGFRLIRGTSRCSRNLCSPCCRFPFHYSDLHLYRGHSGSHDFRSYVDAGDCGSERLESRGWCAAGARYDATCGCRDVLRDNPHFMASSRAGSNWAHHLWDRQRIPWALCSPVRNRVDCAAGSVDRRYRDYAAGGA
jgi:hypothetical protein